MSNTSTEVNENNKGLSFIVRTVCIVAMAVIHDYITYDFRAEVLQTILISVAILLPLSYLIDYGLLRLKQRTISSSASLSIVLPASVFVPAYLRKGLSVETFMVSLIVLAITLPIMYLIVSKIRKSRNLPS